MKTLGFIPEKRGKYIRTPEMRVKFSKTMTQYFKKHPQPKGKLSPFWKRLNVVCENCGIAFTKIQAEIKSTNHNYCSRECRYIGQRLPAGQSNRNEVLVGYKHHAKKRGLKFSLTDGEVDKLFKGNCFYCGLEPKMKGRNSRHYGEFLYNGIDRIDPHKGYITGNVVSCCQMCNVMKWKYSKEEFLEHLERILKWQKR